MYVCVTYMFVFVYKYVTHTCIYIGLGVYEYTQRIDICIQTARHHVLLCDVHIATRTATCTAAHSATYTATHTATHSTH